MIFLPIFTKLNHEYCIFFIINPKGKIVIMMLFICLSHVGNLYHKKTQKILYHHIYLLQLRLFELILKLSLYMPLYAILYVDNFYLFEQ